MHLVRSLQGTKVRDLPLAQDSPARRSHRRNLLEVSWWVVRRCHSTLGSFVHKSRHRSHLCPKAGRTALLLDHCGQGRLLLPFVGSLSMTSVGLGGPVQAWVFRHCLFSKLQHSCLHSIQQISTVSYVAYCGHCCFGRPSESQLYLVWRFRWIFSRP